MSQVSSALGLLCFFFLFFLSLRMHKARGELLLPVNGFFQSQFQEKTIQGLQVTRLTGRPTFAFEFFIQFDMLLASA